MAKLTLADIGAGFGLITTYNANNALIEAAIENTLSRDGTTPNQMEADFDMNSNRVINLEDGIDPQDAVTVFQLEQAAFGGLAFPLRGPDGSAVAPTYSFLNDTGAGMFLNAVGEVGFAANGVEIARAIEGTTNQFAVSPGSGSLPGLTSLNDLDTGFVWNGSNQVVWMGGGSEAWNFSTGRFFSEFSGGPSLENTTAQDDVPTVLPNQGDSNTGLGSGGNDEFSGIAGGVEIWRAVEDGGDDQFIVMPGVISLSQTKPALAFDDGNTGFFQAQANSIDVTLGSSPQFSFFGGQFKTWIGGGGGIVNVQTLFNIPSLVVNNVDTDNGLGYDIGFVDNMTLIAGGVAGVRIRELASHIIQTNENHTGLTADPSQTQALGLALLSSYNEIATVAIAGDSVTAAPVKAGDRLVVINNGVNDLQLFPAVGDDIGAGVDTAITITAGEVGIFLGRDTTSWDTLYNDAPGGGVTVGTGADNQVAVFTGPSGIEGNDNFLWDGAVLSTFDPGTTDGLSQGHDGLKYNFSFNNSNSVDFTGSTSSYQFDRGIAVIPSVGGQFVSVFDPTVGGGVATSLLATGLTQAGAGVGTFALQGMSEVAVLVGTSFRLNDYTFPTGDGGADQVIATDGAGALSFVNPVVGGGLLSGQYRFSTSTVASDPGSGLFRYNSATPASVTEVFIDDVTSNGVDISNILGIITTGDRLYIQSEADSAAFIVFNVTAPATDNTGWFTLTGTVEASGTLHGSNVRTLFVLQIGGSAAGLANVVDDLTPQLGGDLDSNGSDIDMLDNDAVTFGSSRDVAISYNTQNMILNSVVGNTAWHFSESSVSKFIIDLNTNEIGVRDGLRLTVYDSTDANRIRQFHDATDYNFESLGATTDVNFTGLSGRIKQGAETLAFLSEIPAAGLANIVEDVTPQLGATLDTNGFNIENLDTSTLDLSVIAGTDGSGNGGTLTIRAGASGGSSTKGGSVVIEATNGAGGGAEGGDITLTCGNANGSGDDGGDFLALAGDGTGGSGDGGTATVQAGSANGAGDGGIASLIGGEGNNGAGVGGLARVIGGLGGANGGDGGGVEITGGAGVTAASDGAGGDVTITGGAGTVAEPDGNVILAVVGATNILFDHTTGRLEQGAETFAYQSDIPAAPVVIVNDVAQARRTTDLELTTAFVDVTLDTTDVETDDAVVNHDLATNTDNIIVGVTGTYKITYGVDIETDTVNESTITAEARVRINDSGVGIPGSDALCGVFSDGSIPGDFMQNHLSQTFYVNLTASDFVTLQLEKVEISGSDDYFATRTLFTVERVQ